MKAAEDRAEALITRPAASKEAQHKAVEAFRLFHQAVGDLNKGLLHWRQEKLDMAQHCLITGHDVLAVCVERLTELIPDELEGELVFLRDGAYTMRGYAPTLSTRSPAPDRPALLEADDLGARITVGQHRPGAQGVCSAPHGPPGGRISFSC